ncbi:hypothetical protein [Terribacillus aidingensis]|uniref:hypothetical protein n=1 Tax=Terribacillus aidingensis TaxID=586416 RepID=UPI00344B6EBE
MIKYNYRFRYIEKYITVVMDFDEEKHLKFANMISDPLGSDISLRIDELKEDVDNYIKLLKGLIPRYDHGGNASSVISYKDVTIIEDPFFDEDEDSTEPICKLETIEFLKIILIWARENYKYKCKREVITREEAELALNWIEQKIGEVKTLEEDE